MKTGFYKKVAAGALALLLSVGSFCFGGMKAEASYYVTYTNAAQVCSHVYKGYNGGAYGPITVTKGTLKNGWNERAVYLITLSGTESVSNQSTGYVTDALAGFNLSNPYVRNCVNVISTRIPKNSNLVLAGHSLGGMVAQQVAADSTIKNNYNVLNTVTFGSPLLAAGTREGDVKRLGDTSDVIPYASGSLINNAAWAIAGLNREDGGYGWNAFDAHTKSYTRTDVWGKYDAVGQKYGGAQLILDMGTLTYYKSPTSVK